MNIYNTVVSGVMAACGLVIAICMISMVNKTFISTNTGTQLVESGIESEAENSTAEDVSTGSDKDKSEVDLADYVTYFDLVYAAYTNPSQFLNKEITVIGYYSNSAAMESSTSESSETSEEDSSNVYHFITTYGQIDECHVTAEFTTATGEYPEVGDVIQITGKFTSYEEDGITYYTIAADGYTNITT